ncbi:MAG: Zinc phosphodiesterase ELAC protein 2 [Watsoniomyces obsoletus]|nr:MAG: Zinc phosphodiesterase ELAC protein 2 [Watsoniomyces obsoletus]
MRLCSVQLKTRILPGAESTLAPLRIAWRLPESTSHLIGKLPILHPLPLWHARTSIEKDFLVRRRFSSSTNSNEATSSKTQDTRNPASGGVLTKLKGLLKQFFRRGPEVTRPRRQPSKAARRRAKKMAAAFPSARKTIYCQFVSTPTADTPGTALLLHVAEKRYLFGHVAEGTQRAIQQQSLKIVKLSEIFLTGSVNWSTMGGLLGLVLSVADMQHSAKLQATETRMAAAQRQQSSDAQASRPASGVGSGTKAQAKKGQDVQQSVADDSPMTLHAGRNLVHMLATARKFVLRRTAHLELHEIDEDIGPSLASGASRYSAPNATENVPERSNSDVKSQWPPTWKDENIRVWAFLVDPQNPRPSGRKRKASSPQKRRHEALEEEDSSSGERRARPSSSKSAKARDDETRRAVVSTMFGSSWSPEDMRAMPLSEVPSGAKAFMRDEKTGKMKAYVPSQPVAPSEETSTPSGSDPEVFVRKPWPGASVNSLPSTSPSSRSLCYFIKGHTQRGKFSKEKALALKVRGGRDFGLLAGGRPVPSTDGKIITPDMVLGEPLAAGGLAILDIPTVAYVEGIINRREWQSEELMKGLGAMIWLLGPGVGQDRRLLDFVKKMSHMEHIVSSTDHCTNHLTFESGAAMAIKLSQVDSGHFPIPVHSNLRPLQITANSPAEVRESLTVFRPAERGMIVQLAPSLMVQDNKVLPFLDTAAELRITPKKVLELSQTARENLSDPAMKRQIEKSQNDLPGQDAEIITLGTGSMIPSKYRNVSATLLRIPGVGAYLFDCGENTMGQLRRVFPADELKEVLRELKAIWISHLHADHHLGTVSVIKAWREAVSSDGIEESPRQRSGKKSEDSTRPLNGRQRRLAILSHDFMLKWLKEYAEVEDIAYDQLLLLGVRPMKKEGEPRQTLIKWCGPNDAGEKKTDISDLRDEMLSFLGMSDLQAVYVSHCHGALAVSCTFPNGFKFSYSGDCRPCQAFAEIGKDSTVLLHEATFDDELKKDAKAKKHSTTGEALAVATAMGARRVLLTHFSQRYPKLPVLDNIDFGNLQLDTEDVQKTDDSEMIDPLVESNGLDEPMADEEMSDDPIQPPAEDSIVKVETDGIPDMKVAVAFDYMRVKVGEISHLEHFTPALRELFETD